MISFRGRGPILLSAITLSLLAGSAGAPHLYTADLDKGTLEVIGSIEKPSSSLDVHLRFVPSALKGGGFYTGVALAPGASPTIILAGGNSGYHRSTDLGATSEARNKDLLTLPLMRLASVGYHPTRPGVVYGGSGNRGKDGGFERSLDDGLTWQVVSDVPQFAGQDPGIAALPDHPRSTGTLIAAYGPAGATTVWVATLQQGVMRSPDDGFNWKVIGLEGKFLRTLALHPSDPDVLYTAAYHDGVFVTTNALDEVVTFTKLTGAPIETEELAFVGETLYAAAGTSGLYRFDGSDWERMSVGVPAGSTWTAITGFPSGDSAVLFAGCYKCGLDPGGHYATIIRSTDGGATWHSVTRPDNVDFRVVGTGERWVFADAVPNYMLGGVDAIVSQLVVRPAADGDPDRALVLMAGRGGMWRSTNGGTTWVPAANGLSETNSQSMAIDPQDPTRIYQGAAHFGLQFTQDAFETVGIDLLGNGTTLKLAPDDHPTALWTAFDTSTRPSTVIIAGGDADVAKVGGVFLNRDPFSSDRWEDLGYSAQVPQKQPTSLAVGYDALGTRVIVAAAHPRGGLYRKVGDGPWVRVADPVILTKASPPKSDMVWVPGTQLIYFYDLAQGVFRSNDGGVTWTWLWAHPSAVLDTGSLAVRPNEPGMLFVAAADGLYRLAGADAGAVETGEVTLTRLGSYEKASDVFLDGRGRLWATMNPSPTSPMTVAVSRDPTATRPTFEDMTDELLQGTMVQPETLVVTDDGKVLIGGSRSGTLRGLPNQSRRGP